VALSFAITLAIRYLLVVLFLPFSALDKILNFKGAVAQAREAIPWDRAAKLAILAGLCVEIVMPLGILTGVADRRAAFIMAGYCAVTALLWKRFWQPGDFWKRGPSRARDLLWDDRGRGAHDHSREGRGVLTMAAYDLCNGRLAGRVAPSGERIPPLGRGDWLLRKSPLAPARLHE
jgi:putative oxidoreductase